VFKEEFAFVRILFTLPVAKGGGKRKEGGRFLILLGGGEEGKKGERGPQKEKKERGQIKPFIRFSCFTEFGCESVADRGGKGGGRKKG